MRKSKATVITTSKDRGEDYWKEQINQIEFLKEVYISVYSLTEEQATIFKTEKADWFFDWFYDKIYAVTKISNESFDTDEWLTQVNDGDGILKVTMRKIIQYVCEYQKHREDRPPFRSGFVNDPTNLLCYELNTWCVQLSRGGEETIASVCSEDGELSKRIRFLETIINDSKKRFKPGDSSKITLPQTLQYASNILKELKKNLNLYIMNRSAREDFELVVNASNDLLQFGVDFLHFSIYHKNKKKNSLISDIHDLRHPKHKTLISRMDCETGRMMQCLVNSPAFLNVFEDQRDWLEETKVEVSPVSLIGVLKPAVLSEERAALVNYLMCSSSVKSGILEIFNNERIISEYVELHVLLNELAKFVYAAKLLFNLSGEGGNLFVYGLINKPVEEILGCFIGCLEETQTAFNNFMQLLDKYKMKLIENRQFQSSAWGLDYSRVVTNHERFIQKSKMCVTHLAKIRDKARESTVEKIKQKIESNLLKLITVCRTLCKEWGDIDISRRFVDITAPAVKGLFFEMDDSKTDDLKELTDLIRHEELASEDNFIDEDTSVEKSNLNKDVRCSIEDLIKKYPGLADYTLHDLSMKFRKYSGYVGNSTLVDKYITIACNYLNTGSSFEETIRENRLKILRAGCACVKYYHHNDYDESLLIQHIKATSDAIFLKKVDPEAKGLYFEFKRSTFFGRVLRSGSELEMDYIGLKVYIDKERKKELKKKQRVLRKQYKAVQTDLNQLKTTQKAKNIRLNDELERLRITINSSTKSESQQDVGQLRYQLRGLCAMVAKMNEELVSLKDTDLSQSSHINELTEALVEKIAKIEHYEELIPKLAEEIEVMRNRINDLEQDQDRVLNDSSFRENTSSGQGGK